MGYPDIIDVGNEKFVVIQKSSSDDVVSTMQPGEYVNELEIPRAEVSDSGMYYCFVTNAFGFKYKNAYLEVVPVNVISQPTPTTTSTATSSSWDTGLTILVACLAIFVFILIAILVGYVIKKRFLDPKGASRSANSSAAIPTSEGSEVQENLMRNQNAYYEYQQQHHSAPFRSIEQHSAAFSSIQQHSAAFSSIQHRSAPFSTIQHHPAPFSTIQHHSTPFNTIPDH